MRVSLDNNVCIVRDLQITYEYITLFRYLDNYFVEIKWHRRILYQFIIAVTSRTVYRKSLPSKSRFQYKKML